MLRYRRNINCLTTDQLHDLREALTEIYALPGTANNGFERIAGLHGSPSPTWCIHGSPGFLTWHRIYLSELEDALRSIRPNVVLPYWNWSSGPTTGVPAACSSPTYVDRNGNAVDNPLFSGPIAPGAGGGMTSRRSDIDTTSFGDLAAQGQTALGESDFNSFQSSLNGVHGSVHVRVGGNMSGVSTAGFDPIFYLHHANVDRLWALWQGSHADPLPPNEANLELDPFKKCYSEEHYRGADAFSTDDLGFRYIHYCFIILPWLPLKLVELELPDWWNITVIRSARIRLIAEAMPMRSVELRFFAGESEGDLDAETKTAGNPAFLGSLGVFGMRRKGEKMPDGMGRRGEKVELQLDITEPLRKALRRKKSLQLTVVPVSDEGKTMKRAQLSRIWKPESFGLTVE